MTIVDGSIVAISLQALSSRRGNYTGDGMDGGEEDDRGRVAPSLILLNRITIKRRDGGRRAMSWLGNFSYSPLIPA